MSRAEKLFEAIGLVDDSYIEEAADANRTAVPWQRWGTLAATLVLVAGLGLASVSQLRGCGAKTADTAAPENGWMQESAADTVTTDGAATGSSGEAMEGSDTTEDSALDNGGSDAVLEPSETTAVELAVLTVSEGEWTVDRHTRIEAAEQVTVTDAYRMTNAGETTQEIEGQTVATGETVVIHHVTTAMGEAFMLTPVENVTPGIWTVEIVSGEVTGLENGELTWEDHIFTLS